MASPTIPNVAQAYNAGGTWLNTYLGNQYSQETVVFQNNSGTTLYTGDVVCSGNSTSGTLVSDPTGLGVGVTGTASTWSAIGVVGGEAYNPGNTTANLMSGGDLIPPASSAWVYSTTGTWSSASTTLTDANGSAANIGKAVYGYGWPATPGQQPIVTAFSAGAYTVSVASTAANPTTPTYYLGPAEGAVGPGWPGLTAFGAGSPMPVVIYGWAYINIGAATITYSATAGGTPLNQSGTARIAAQTAVALGTVGSYIAVPLESGTGVVGPDGVNHLIRAWICRA